ncbi:MAG: sulfatase [Pirellulales bacterium]|nr:sulfatase [Pirellulales bacterium]
MTIQASPRFPILVATVCFALSPQAWADEAAKARPNFVVFIADDVSWDDVGAYGHPTVRTPVIDRLADEGMRFDRAFLTCSSCSPTRCSILTGRYPHSTGAQNLHTPLPADQVMFTTSLHKAGYFTGAAGKWHLDGGRGQQGKAARQQFDLVLSGGGGLSGCKKWVTLLRRRPRDKPFFLWLASHDAHRPYQDKIISKPHTAGDARVPPYLPDLLEVRKDLAQYYDEITRVDLHIGKVLDELKQQGVAENTFVLFLADNGRPFPRCKTTVYDSGVRTPFIVRWPGRVAPSTVTESLVSVVDIGPTVLQIAGIAPLPSFQGKSFLPILEDPTAEIRQYAFSEHNWHVFKAFERSVRSKRYRYIFNGLPHLPNKFTDASPTIRAMDRLCREGKMKSEWLDCYSAPLPAEALYDCEADPHSLKNLAGDPKYADTLAELRDILADWRKRTDDVRPAKLKEDRKDISREPYVDLNKSN